MNDIFERIAAATEVGDHLYNRRRSYAQLSLPPLRQNLCCYGQSLVFPGSEQHYMATATKPGLLGLFAHHPTSSATLHPQ
jgi:hypothetical protein